jgi:hypothetical protein
VASQSMISSRIAFCFDGSLPLNSPWCHQLTVCRPHTLVAIRVSVFGQSEDNNLVNLCRTATVETIARNAEDMRVSAKLANVISATNSIHKSYAPVDLAQVRAPTTLELRDVGASERNRTGRKV